MRAIAGVAVLALAGLVLGVVGALVVTKVMTSLLYGVSATDPAAFVLAPGVLALSRSETIPPTTTPVQPPTAEANPRSMPTSPALVSKVRRK